MSGDYGARQSAGGDMSRTMDQRARYAALGQHPVGEDLYAPRYQGDILPVDQTKVTAAGMTITASPAEYHQLKEAAKWVTHDEKHRGVFASTYDESSASDKLLLKAAYPELAAEREKMLNLYLRASAQHRLFVSRGGLAGFTREEQAVYNAFYSELFTAPDLEQYYAVYMKWMMRPMGDPDARVVTAAIEGFLSQHAGAPLTVEDKTARPGFFSWFG